LITDPFNSQKGTHWDTGPLIYAHTTWATHSDVGDNTVAGDELYIYNPSTSVAAGVETFIAYNARSACWRDWHLGNDPDHVSQFSSTNTVTCWVAGQRYFQFISPFPLTVTTLEPATTTSTSVPKVPYTSPIDILTGDYAALYKYLYTVTDSTDTSFVHGLLYPPELPSVYMQHSIKYDTINDIWEDHGDGNPVGPISQTVNANGTRTISFLFYNANEHLSFIDPYY
jgi:hypothetical protein